MPGLFGRRGERDLLSLKKQNSGLVLVVQEWGDLWAITVKTSSLQISPPAPLSLQLSLPNPHRARGLALQLLEKEYPPLLSVIGVMKTSFLIGK